LELGAEDDGELLDEVGDVDADVGEDVTVEEGDVEDGVLEDEDEDEDEDDEVGELEEVGEEGVEDKVVGEREELGADDDAGTAALRLAIDINEIGPELNRIAERDTTITTDKIRNRLLIVTFALLS
jgi:hypothetical protein